MATKTYNLVFEGYWRAGKVGGLPAVSGIYCVYAARFQAWSNTVSLRRLLYVGESENVHDRVGGHERWTDWHRRLQSGEELCFSAAAIAPESDRQRAEAAVINHHKPPCNTEYVNGFPFDRTEVTTSGASGLLTARFVVMPEAAAAAAWR